MNNSQHSFAAEFPATASVAVSFLSVAEVLQSTYKIPVGFRKKEQQSKCFASHLFGQSLRHWNL